MIRKLLAVTALTAALLIAAPAASATPNVPTPPTPAPRPRPAPVAFVKPIPPRCTTSWQHYRTGRPVTRRGAVCRATSGQRIPLSWPVVGVDVVRGHLFLLYQRPGGPCHVPRFDPAWPVAPIVSCRSVRAA